MNCNAHPLDHVYASAEQGVHNVMVCCRCSFGTCKKILITSKGTCATVASQSLANIVSQISNLETQDTHMLSKKCFIRLLFRCII